MRQHKSKPKHSEAPKEYVRRGTNDKVSDPLPPCLSGGSFRHTRKEHIPKVNMGHLPKGAQLFTSSRGDVIALMPMRIGYRVLNPAKMLYMDTVMTWWVDSHLEPIPRGEKQVWV